MIPHHVALLAPALRPSLVAADSALQAAGVSAHGGPSDLAALIRELNAADTGLADALRELSPLIERKSCPDEAIYDAAEAIRSQLRRLIVAYREACTLGIGASNSSGISSEATLCKAARDVLVTYAHFLAELISVTAQPWSMIGNGAVTDGNNHWDITFHCKTDLPDTLDQLARWIPSGLAYDQAGVNRALRVSVADQAAMHETTLTPAPSAAAAPNKGLSFWEVIGIAGFLSLFSGCNHDE